MELDVLDIVFLKGTEKPTLAILNEAPNASGRSVRQVVTYQLSESVSLSQLLSCLKTVLTGSIGRGSYSWTLFCS